MSRFSALCTAAIIVLACAACSQSERQRLDTALSGDCNARIAALDKLLPELSDTAIKQEAAKALSICRTETERIKVQQLFEDPEKNLEELLKLQTELKSAGRAGLIENAYNGYLSKLFAEGNLVQAERLYRLLLNRGLVHPTSIAFATAFINCKYEGCYDLAKRSFASMLLDDRFIPVREKLYHIWLEVVSRLGSYEDLEEATFVAPCIFSSLSQSTMQISMEYQIKAADMRRNAGQPERVVGALDCAAYNKKQAELLKAPAPAAAPQDATAADAKKTE